MNIIFELLTTEFLCAFLIGGAIYVLIELLYRGYSHWTMFLTGAFCFTDLYLISTRTNWNLIVKCVVGAIVITVIEFIVGYTVNHRLHWDVWDYSLKRYNILGQICPLFTIYWFVLCFPGIGLAVIIKGFF